MSNKQSVCIGFLGNAYNDSRVTNLYHSLTTSGHTVKVISFDWTTPGFSDIKGQISVFKLDKSLSSLKYYANFFKILYRNIRKEKSDIFIAEDVYTLPLMTIIAKLKKKKIYYDCRELYPFLAGLRNKRTIQMLIRIIERIFIKRVDVVIATGPMDVQFIQHYYKITNPILLRNLPKLKTVDNTVNLKQKLNIPLDSKILLYQGVIFEGRGIQKTIEAMPNLKLVHFVLLGEGNKRKEYEKLAKELNIDNRVHFLGTVSQAELINYTAAADFGLALIENISLSYYYALPNKMFEYIAAGVPVISSALPQMKEIVDTYNVGWIINIDQNCIEEKLSSIINTVYNRDEMRKSLHKAGLELNWDTEFEKVRNTLFV
jgi:glycosyltransferase involved in cell wall biosynthesis